MVLLILKEICLEIPRYSILSVKSVCKIRTILSRKMCAQIESSELNRHLKAIAPALIQSKHKGQAGRIGVFGGSLEYTGAPYFAAITALKVGADLAHVFCTRDAAPVIKSYSPELIVHPLLDGSSAIIEPWLDRLHVIIIGPGLGREPSTFQTIRDIIKSCAARRKPLVIDADGLFLIAAEPELLKNYPETVVLTPNVAEFGRLMVDDGDDGPKQQRAAKLLALAPAINIVCKGREDEIFDKSNWAVVEGGGSGGRCGGQGDLLAGTIATFLAWTLNNDEFDTLTYGRPLLAGYAACKFVRSCNAEAFRGKGRSMTASDMIEQVHAVFERDFERPSVIL